MGFLLPNVVLPFLRLDFPPAPIATSFEEGFQLAKKGFPVDATEGDEFQPLGFWFDGRIQRPVDHVVWVNADMASRWLGWLAEKGEWSNSLVASRWQSLSAKLGGRVTFILVLCAFPRLDPLDYGTGKEADPAASLRPYCRISFSAPHAMDWGGRTESYWQFNDQHFDSGKFVPQLSWSGRAFSWHKFWDAKFYESTPIARLFEPNDYKESGDDDLPLGNFYGAKWLISIPIEGLPGMINHVTFQVIRPGKVSEAEFSPRVQEVPPTSKESDEDSGGFFGQND